MDARDTGRLLNFHQLQLEPQLEPQYLSKPHSTPLDRGESGPATAEYSHANSVPEEKFHRFGAFLEEIVGDPGTPRYNRLISYEKLRNEITEDFILWVFRRQQKGKNQLFYESKFYPGQTYLELILTLHQKIFAILLSMNCPQLIFAAIDEGLCDLDLPYSQETVCRFAGASPVLRDRFFKAQKRWCCRILEEGEHIDYEENEEIPFLWVKYLGQGNEGTTSLYKSRSSGTLTCIKEFKSLKEALVQELYILRYLQKKDETHEHLIQLFATYTYRTRFYTVMTPVCDCNLFEYLQATKISPQNAKETAFLFLNWMNCMTSAVRYLHYHGVLHRDLKPQNILVKGKRIFLTDIGGSYRKENGDEKSGVLTRHTSDYAAPEIRESGANDPSIGKRADIFSLGCIFADMLIVARGSTVRKFRERRYEADHSFAENTCNVIYFMERTLKQSSRGAENTLFGLILRILEPEKNSRPSSRWVMAYLEVVRDEKFPEQTFCCSIPAAPQEIPGYL